MSGAANPPARIRGQVVAAFGRNFLVESDDGELLRCLPRGKEAVLACGDRVLAERSGDGGVIEAIDPRANLFLRASRHRTKVIAANATQAVIVVAAEPSFSDELLMRALMAASHAQMQSLIVLNKVDLDEYAVGARERLLPFSFAGCRIVETSARHDAAPLRPFLQGQLSIFVGQSGMGKSTLLNALVPDANAATNEISHFLASGRHTTSASRLYRLDPESAFIDSPGMQEFGLAHMSRDEMEAAIPEFRSALGYCRFPDCRHRSEPGCALRKALNEGSVHPRRFELFQRIVDAETQGG